MQHVDALDRDYVPDWLDDDFRCHRCGGELETIDYIALAGWFGANFDEGVERKVECTDCGKTGQVKAFDNGRTSRLGAAAPRVD